MEKINQVIETRLGAITITTRSNKWCDGINISFEGTDAVLVILASEHPEGSGLSKIENFRVLYSALPDSDRPKIMSDKDISFWVEKTNVQEWCDQNRHLLGGE